MTSHRPAGLLLTAAALAAACGCYDAREVAPGTWAVLGRRGAANSLVVRSEFGALVVDAGANLAAGEDLEAIAQKLTRKPVSYVVVTHPYGDRVFGCEAFLAAQIVAHENVRRELVDRWDEQVEFLDKTLGVPGAERVRRVLPNLTYSDRLTLHLGVKPEAPTAEVIHVGRAHTRSDSAVWLPGARVLFTGDLVLDGAVPYARDADLAAWRAALVRLARLEPKVVVPGRGEPGGPERIAAMRVFLDDLAVLAKTDNTPERGSDLEQRLRGYRRWTGYREFFETCLEAARRGTAPPGTARP